MGRYRATINQPGVRVGKEAVLDDDDKSVQQRVVAGYLIPIDKVAINYQRTHLTVEAPPMSNADAIKAALAEARANAAESGRSETSALTSFGKAPNADTYLPEKESPKAPKTPKSN